MSCLILLQKAYNFYVRTYLNILQICIYYTQNLRWRATRHVVFHTFPPEHPRHITLRSALAVRLIPQKFQDFSLVKICWFTHSFINYLVGGFKDFLFSPLPGEDSQFDEHIFQRGWFNHQQVIVTFGSHFLDPLVLVIARPSHQADKRGVLLQLAGFHPRCKGDLKRCRIIIYTYN